MQKNVTYTIVITRDRNGFVAKCPALGDCAVFAPTRTSAYAAVKRRIRRRLTAIIEDFRPPPADPIASVRQLRVDLLELHQEVDLR